MHANLEIFQIFRDFKKCSVNCVQCTADDDDESTVRLQMRPRCDCALEDGDGNKRITSGTSELVGGGSHSSV